MADFQPVNEADLAPPQPPQGSYEPVNDEDMAPAPAGNLPPLRAMMQPGSFSPGVVARLRQGDPVSRTIAKFAEGAGTGYGSSFNDITQNDLETAQKAGMRPVTPDEMNTVGGTLRFYGQSLGAAASLVKASVFSLWPALIEATHQGVTQAATEAGAQNPEAVGREVAGGLDIAGTDAGIQTMLMSRGQYAEATRIVPNPAGGVMDQRIGPVPDHVEAANQAQQVAEHYGIPAAAPAITEAYNKGILPAEIHTDAQTNPTIIPALVEGKTPEAYPVSDWMGGEAPTAATAPDRNAVPAAGAAPAAESVPKPVVPTRLRPIEGTGEQTPMQLSQSVEEQIGKVFDSVPASRVAENDVQEAAARKFVDLDPERADQVAMNGATPPKNLLGQMVFNEVLRRADAAGDMDKVRMLATQGAQSGMLRRFGQEVQAASRLGPEGDTAAAIQQVQDARTAALKAQGVDVPKAVNDEVAAAQTITRQVRTASAQPGAWSDFIASITCK